MNKQKGHLYAAPKDDRNRVFEIEIWEEKTSHFAGSGPDTKWEHNISRRKSYRIKADGDASEAGDHFIIPALDGIAVYPLTEDELKKAGLS
jgi:hypothetical protein